MTTPTRAEQIEACETARHYLHWQTVQDGLKAAAATLRQLQQDQSAGGTALSSPLCTVTGVTADPARTTLVTKINQRLRNDKRNAGEMGSYARELFESARDQIVADGERIAQYGAALRQYGDELARLRQQPTSEEVREAINDDDGISLKGRKLIERLAQSEHNWKSDFSDACEQRRMVEADLAAASAELAKAKAEPTSEEVRALLADGYAATGGYTQDVFTILGIVRRMIDLIERLARENEQLRESNRMMYQEIREIWQALYDASREGKG